MWTLLFVSGGEIGSVYTEKVVPGKKLTLTLTRLPELPRVIQLFMLFLNKTWRTDYMRNKKLARRFYVTVKLLVGPTLLHINTRDLKMRRRRRQRELHKTKKQWVNLISKTTTLHVHHTFLYISLPFVHFLHLYKALRLQLQKSSRTFDKVSEME